MTFMSVLCVQVTWAQFRREYRAVHRVLDRSGLLPRYLVPHRWIHLTGSQFQLDKDDNDKRDNKDDDGKLRQFLMFSNCFLKHLLIVMSFSPPEESKLSLMAKAALWMMTSYIVITLMSLLFPSSNQPEVMRYVSWNEFIHHMLAKGEVCF